jgi:hypothetical protein
LGSICFPDDLLPSLDDSLNYYIMRISEGEDILSILKELEQSSSYYNEPNPNPEDVFYDNWKYYYQILYKRLEQKSKEICIENSSTPEIVIPQKLIYKDFSLTPSCTTKAPTSGTGFLSISLSFGDESGEKVNYTQ